MDEERSEEKRTEGLEGLEEPEEEKAPEAETHMPETEGTEEFAEQATKEEVTEEAGPQAMPREEPGKRTYIEEIQVAAGQALNVIENLLRESSVRRIKVKNKEGRVLFDLPVWAATTGGVVALVAAPAILAFTVLGGALYGLTIEVERVVEEPKGNAA